MPYISDYQKIKEGLSRGEILAQLAEECAELAQAALKLRRVITPGASPTPVCIADAEDGMQEEVADVILCIELAGEYLYDVSATEYVREIKERKEKRWAARIAEAPHNPLA